MPSEIFVKKTEDRKAFAEFGLKKFQKDIKGKILVKPNIVSYEYYPTTTHPDVLRTVLEFLKKKSDVIVADGPAPDAGSSDKVISNHPLRDVCKEFGLELTNIHKHGFEKIKTQSGFVLRVSKLALERDSIISLPVLKGHANCDITGALKNQFGLLQVRDRLMMHGRLKDLHRGVAEINTVIKPKLFIVDAVETYAKNNEKRHGGVPAHLGYMLAGKNPVALDCTGLELMKKVDPGLLKKSPESVEHIRHALELGLGED